MREGYDTAQVCLNGHVVNAYHISSPQFSKLHCKRCGEKTIVACPQCNATIQGYYHSPGIVGYFHGPAPSYCHNCGNAFPWTDRKIEAAIELFLEESGVKGDEAEDFRRNVGDIVRDTPRTPLAAGRFKKAMAKVGAPVGNAIRDIIVDIISESAKKIIWPGK